MKSLLSFLMSLTLACSFASSAFASPELEQVEQDLATLDRQLANAEQVHQTLIVVEVGFAVGAVLAGLTGARHMKVYNQRLNDFENGVGVYANGVGRKPRLMFTVVPIARAAAVTGVAAVGALAYQITLTNDQIANIRAAIASKHEELKAARELEQAAQ